MGPGHCPVPGLSRAGMVVESVLASWPARVKHPSLLQRCSQTLRWNQCLPTATTTVSLVSVPGGGGGTRAGLGVKKWGGERGSWKLSQPHTPPCTPRRRVPAASLLSGDHGSDPGPGPQPPGLQEVEEQVRVLEGPQGAQGRRGAPGARLTAPRQRRGSGRSTSSS